MYDSALVVDDHPIVLQGCRLVLEEAGVTTIHLASGVDEGYESFRHNRPGVVVADLTFRESGLTGLSLIERIRSLEPAARILVFSMHDDPLIVARALEHGAIGYLLKDTPSAHLLAALSQVRAGKPSIDHRLAVEVAILRSNLHRSPLSSLNSRELQILTQLAHGKSYDFIAKDLNLSYRTVANISSTMRRKLGMASLAELIHLAITHQGATSA